MKTSVSSLDLLAEELIAEHGLAVVLDALAFACQARGDSWRKVLDGEEYGSKWYKDSRTIYNVIERLKNKTPAPKVEQ